MHDRVKLEFGNAKVSLLTGYTPLVTSGSSIVHSNKSRSQLYEFKLLSGQSILNVGITCVVVTTTSTSGRSGAQPNRCDFSSVLVLVTTK